jgi:hypothetical protein
MNKYEFEIWFRHGKFDKEFEIVEIDADTESEAESIVKDLRAWIFKVTLLEVNGIKVIKTQN